VQPKKVAKVEPQWHYQDKAGQTQGPFALGNMQDWFVQGFLPVETKVKRGDDAAFFELGRSVEIAGSKAGAERAEVSAAMFVR
jgi:hypothetical protein